MSLPGICSRRAWQIANPQAARLAFQSPLQYCQLLWPVRRRTVNRWSNKSDRFPAPLHVQEVLADLLFGRFLAQLLRRIVRRRLPDQRLAAPGWPVKEKSFRSGMVKFLEQMRMQKRQLDRILDRVDRSLLPADFGPGQFRDVIEIMFVRAGR